MQNCKGFFVRRFETMKRYNEGISIMCNGPVGIAKQSRNSWYKCVAVELII